MFKTLFNKFFPQNKNKNKYKLNLIPNNHDYIAVMYWDHIPMMNSIVTFNNNRNYKVTKVVYLNSNTINVYVDCV